jgi:hypothetical protein
MPSGRSIPASRPRMSLTCTGTRLSARTPIITSTPLDMAPGQPDPYRGDWGSQFSDLRMVMLHVLKETACHAGIPRRGARVHRRPSVDRTRRPLAVPDRLFPAAPQRVRLAQAGIQCAALRRGRDVHRHGRRLVAGRWRRSGSRLARMAPVPRALGSHQASSHADGRGRHHPAALLALRHPHRLRHSHKAHQGCPGPWPQPPPAPHPHRPLFARESMNVAFILKESIQCRIHWFSHPSTPACSGPVCVECTALGSARGERPGGQGKGGVEEGAGRALTGAQSGLPVAASSLVEAGRRRSGGRSPEVRLPGGRIQ